MKKLPRALLSLAVLGSFFISQISYASDWNPTYNVPIISLELSGNFPQPFYNASHATYPGFDIYQFNGTTYSYLKSHLGTNPILSPITDIIGVLNDGSYRVGLIGDGSCTNNDYCAYADFVMVGGSIQSNTNTKILNWVSPTGGSITSSTTVTLSFSYFFNDGDTPQYEYAGIDLRDLTSPTQISIQDTSISSSGTNTYSRTRVLSSGHAYIATPYLRNASSTDFLRDNTITFSVISNPAGYSPLTDAFATSTATSTEPLVYLNLVSLLQNKYPISYVPQIISLVKSEATLTGTSTFPNLTFDFTDTRLGSTTLGLGHVEMFGTSTITYFFHQTQVDQFKTLIRYVLWVSFVLFLVRDIRRTILKTRV